MYRQMTACYLAAVRALNLDRVKVVHLCQLRLGGARSNHRDILEIQRRRTWKSIKKIRRCKSEGRLGEVLGRLARVHSEICIASLNKGGRSP